MTAILTLLNLIPRWVLALAIAALALTSGKLLWQNKGLIADLATANTSIANYQTAIATANARAAQESATLTQKVLEAQNDAKKRETALRADVQSARNALDSLRHAADLSRAAYRLTGVPPNASADTADAAIDLLVKCSERYTDLAARADGHVSDIKTLTQAWPAP